MLRRLTLPVLAVLTAQLVVTSVFVLAMHARFVAYRRHKGALQPGDGAWLRISEREIAALWLAQVWHLRLPGAHRRRIPEVVQGNLVVCVHGFTQDGTNFQRLQQRLLALGRPTEAVRLGYPPRAFERYAAALEARLVALCAEVSGPIDVVCHSMGGLVLRHVLAARPELCARIDRVVTLGSPHHGTASGRGLVLLPEVRFMGRRSAELARLPHLPELLPHARITNVGSEDDTTVYPVETTFEDGADHVRLAGLGHVGLLVWPEAIAATIDALDKPPLRATG